MYLVQGLPTSEPSPCSSASIVLSPACSVYSVGYICPECSPSLSLEICQVESMFPRQLVSLGAHVEEKQQLWHPAEALREVIVPLEESVISGHSMGSLVQG